MKKPTAIKTCVICLMLTVFASPVIAQTEAYANITVQPEGDLLAGQLFTLNFEVMTETFFPSPPVFPRVTLENALAIQPEQSGSNFSRRIDGKMFTGIRQRYLVSSHRAGELEIPSFEIQFEVASVGSPREPETFNLATEALSVNLLLPPGLQSIENIAVTTGLRLTEEFSADMESLQVGDAFTRRVTVAADSTLAFMLPEIEFLPVEGLTVYPSRAKFEDNTVRGRAQGIRIDAATYLLQTEGAISLPPISISWFNMDTQSLESLELEAHSFDVAVNPIQESVVISTALSEQQNSLLVLLVDFLNWLAERWMQIATLVLGVLLLITLYRRYWSIVRTLLIVKWDRSKNSSTGRFIAVLLACAFRSSQTAKAMLMSWLLVPDNQTFKHTKVFSDWQHSYRGDGESSFPRLKLIAALIPYQVGKFFSAHEYQASRLNP